MSQETSYLKLGTFTIAALTMLAVLIIALGSGNLFTTEKYAETYFDSSVQGLIVGSPVKYRGVNIGKVESIEIANQIYRKNISANNPAEQRYIYVKFSITADLPITHNGGNMQDMINKSIHHGLRINLAAQDLIGNSYLELNFVDPEKNPVLNVSWKPKYTYIPSMESTLSRFTESVDKIFTQFSEIDFKKLVDNFTQMANTINTTLQQANIGKISESLDSTLSQINHMLDKVNGVIDSPQTKQVGESLLNNMQLLEETLKQTSDTMDQLSMLASRANELSASQQQTISETLDGLRQTSENLQGLSAKIENNPSSLIFSKPAQPMDL